MLMSKSRCMGGRRRGEETKGRLNTYDRKVDLPTPESPKSRMGTSGASAIAGPDMMISGACRNQVSTTANEGYHCVRVHVIAVFYSSFVSFQVNCAVRTNHSAALSRNTPPARYREKMVNCMTRTTSSLEHQHA